METKDPIFIDGITDLSFTQGTFRFELATYGETFKADDGKKKVKINHHGKIVMSPQGFLQTVTALQKFLKEIEDKGAVRFTKAGEED